MTFVHKIISMLSGKKKTLNIWVIKQKRKENRGILCGSLLPCDIQCKPPWSLLPYLHAQTEGVTMVLLTNYALVTILILAWPERMTMIVLTKIICLSFHLIVACPERMTMIMRTNYALVTIVAWPEMITLWNVKILMIWWEGFEWVIFCLTFHSFQKCDNSIAVRLKIVNETIVKYYSERQGILAKNHKEKWLSGA